jgi:O-methyltransferase involved in polyketide biosynthesis
MSRFSASETISPTALYTAAVWSRNGLSHPALATAEGRALFWALEPLMVASRTLGGPSLEPTLLARHRLIDHLLAEAIDAGRVSQVIEVASGLSGRGWRFAERFGARITYVETDLPDMAARKRAALDSAGVLGAHHRVVELDAMSDGGPDSIAAVAAGLDREGGLAVVTEGLLNYYGRDDVEALWARIAEALRAFAHGLYLADLRLASDALGLPERAFAAGLSAFVRGSLHLHFADAGEAERELRDAGFTSAAVVPARTHPAAGPPGERARARGVHVVEAGT